MSGCSGNDRCQMWREFLGCRPLIESCVGTAPHCNLAVAKRLLGQPLDDVVAIARVVCKWLELTAGISATANIDKRKCIAMRCEVGAARVIRIRDVRRECEDDRRLG